MSRRRGLIGASKPYLYKEEDAEFYYRQTSGGVIMNNSPLVGSIDRIKGQTIAWNQLVENGNFVNTNGWTSTATRSASNNVLYVSGQGNNQIIHQQSYIVGHKYIGFASVKTSESVLIYYRFVNTLVNVLVGTSWQRISQMLSVTSGNENKPITMYVYTEGTSYEVRDVVLFDLTLIYGAGNEPSTVAQFEADYQRWFGKPLTYEPYDEGGLRNVQMEGIKSVGFNQWDEEWELGMLDDSGQPSTGSNRLRSKNFIPCFGNESYYVYSGSTNTGRLCFYDANYNYISFYNSGLNHIVTTPINARFMKFFIYKNGITTYNNDICINISNTAKNGTYKPYKSETRNFDVTTLTGKLNGEGESVVIFPDGMKGVNDVKDEIYIEDGITKAIKRVDRVDLGEINWIYKEKYCYFHTNTSTTVMPGSPKHPIRANAICNIKCGKYITGNASNSTIAKTSDKRIWIGFSGFDYGPNYPIIRDLTYSDATTFKTAMSGVYLDYELAEPQVYVLDTPLPISYNCEAGGTEEILPEEIGTGIAPIMDIKYNIGQINN